MGAHAWAATLRRPQTSPAGLVLAPGGEQCGVYSAARRYERVTLRGVNFAELKKAGGRLSCCGARGTLACFLFQAVAFAYVDCCKGYADWPHALHERNAGL